MNFSSDDSKSYNGRHNLKSHAGFLIILLLSALLFFINLNAYKKFERAEAFFSLGSKMLVKTGEFLLPHSLQEMPLNKPPLQYWLIGAAYKVFGVSYGAGRVPAALCALAILALIYFFGLRFYEKNIALTATGIAATTWMFISFARLAMPDLTLTLCAGIALCSWILVLTDKTDYPEFFALLGYAAAALAFLTKGPVGLVIAFAPIALEILITRDFKSLKKLLPVRGLLVFLVIAAPYFLLVGIYHGVEPLHTFFIVENLERFTGAGGYRSRTASWEYPLTAFLGGFAPWSLLTLVVAFSDFKYRKQVGQPRLLRILYFWLIIPLVFFCVSSFKLDYYLLPVIPALALLTARIVSPKFLALAWGKKLLVVFSIVLTVILAAGLGGGLTYLTEFFPAMRFPYLPVLLAIVSFVPLVFCLVRRQTRYLLIALAFQIWLIFFYLCAIFIPAFSSFQPAWTFADKIPSEARVYFYGEAGGWIPNLAFQLPSTQFIKEFDHLPDAAEINDLPHENSPAMLVIYEEDLAKLSGLDSRWKIVGEENVYGESSLSLKFIAQPIAKKLMLVSNR